ncbi:MAG: cytochrome c biosis protein CcsA [Verrucomicrobiota bacterium]
MGMDRWFLITSTLLAAVGAAWGMISVHRGSRSPWTVAWISGAFLCQIGFLSVRGQARAACPLTDSGEILVFLAWSLTLFYLLVGPAYRISLLGVFTAPVVVIFQGLALVPGTLTADPQKIIGGNPWHETHSAMSVLAYGALALAAVAGVMFLVLDKQLKEHHLKSGLFRNLPPVRELLVSMERLLWLGGVLLTVGIVAGFLMPHTQAAWGHLIAAVAVWVAYLVLLGVKQVRGLTGRRFSLSAVLLFILSLVVFAFV